MLEHGVAVRSTYEHVGSLTWTRDGIGCDSNGPNSSAARQPVKSRVRQPLTLETRSIETCWCEVLVVLRTYID
jgi:hypothetical protein